MNYTRLILSRFGGLGDMVMLTPLLRGIKVLYPNVTLTVVGHPNARDIMTRCPFVDEYFTYDKSLHDTLFLIRKLWRSDFVYLMDTLYRISTVYAMARIKVRVGLPHKRKKFLTHYLSVKPWMNYAFEPVVYASFLKEATGIDVMQLPDWDRFYFPEANDEEKERVQALLKGKLDDEEGYIVCSLETGSWQKDWLIEYWQELFEKLKVFGKKVIIIGSSPQRATGCRLSSNVIDLRGKTNLLETGYVIDQADLLINGCSLPVHIANAMDTPVIGLYGSQPDYRARPQRIYRSLCSQASCAPCDMLFGSSGYCDHPYCMDSITPEIVMNAVKDFYAEGMPLGDNNFKLIYEERISHEPKRKI